MPVVLDRIFAGKSTFFISKDNEVYVCGCNKYGQLGLGHNNDVLEAVKTDFMHVDKIYCGEHHNIFVTTVKTGYGAGNNQYGQLGIGTVSDYENVPKPLLIRDIEGVGFCGLYTIFIQTNNIISVSGAAPNESIVRSSPVYESDLGSIIVADGSSLVVDTMRNRPHVLGKNQYGCLGNFTINSIPEEKEISAFTGINKIDKILCGGEHVVILSNESVYTIGNNERHQLGYDSPETYMSTPGIINVNDIVDIAVGYEHTLLLTKDGKVYGFGSNEYGQLGLTSRPSIVKTPTLLMEDVMKIYCGEYNSFVVKKSGSIFMTGYNEEGQLGIGHKIDIPTWIVHPFFTFDTEIKNLPLPENIEEEFICGNIKHNIIIEYSSDGKDMMYTKCYISTPSMNKVAQNGPTFSNRYNTNTIRFIGEHAEYNAKTLIAEAKSYIKQHTILHRDAVYKTVTTITFNNGTTIKREGDLSEEECMAIAKEYIENKYKILRDKVKYYQSHEFYHNYVLGDPLWKPKYGSEIYALSELDPNEYNTY